MDEMQDKLSSTGAGISRENSLSSLPETECDWPHQEPTPLALLTTDADLNDATATWQYNCPPIAPPPHSPVLNVSPGDEVGQGSEMVSHVRPVDMATSVPSVDMASSQLSPQALYFQVAFLGGIEVRSGPDLDAPRTGLVLMQGEVIAVSSHIPGADGRIYLQLANGQGWVFDDTALVPHDPSVIQLPYVAPQTATPIPQHWAAPAVGELILPPPLPAPGAEALVHPLPPAPIPPPPLHPSSQGKLLASSPANVASRPPSPVSWFRVSYLGGINLRSGPSIDAPLTGITLPQMETFPVAEEVPGADGRIYLLLCDGRGWAFDDSALMPLDPSVKRGSWMQAQAAGQIVGTRVLQEVQADALPVRRRMHPQPRGKRGGKRCSRRAQNAANAAAAANAVNAASADAGAAQVEG